METIVEGGGGGDRARAALLNCSFHVLYCF